MFSAISPNNSNKLSIYLKTQSDTDVRSRHHQIYEEKQIYLNQLENFYLPFMKQIYNANKEKLQGTVKSPQQLFKALRNVQSKQSQTKRRYEPYKRDSEYKDAKIKQLTAKVIQLSNQIKNIKPDEQIDLKIKKDSNEQQKLKRMQDLLKIKNEQSMFRIKVKAINLLQDFEINKNQIEQINKLQTVYELFQSMITKVKSKLKFIKNKQKNSIEEIKRQKFQLQAYEQKIKFLQQSNQMLRNNQKKNRQKIQQIKKEWKIVCDRLVARDKQYQVKQNQLYQLKKLFDQKQSLLMKSTVNQKNNLSQQQNSRKQIQTQIKQLKSQMNNYALQLNELRSSNEQKQSTIEQCKIKIIFLQEECQRMNRQYIRWKERYQTIQQSQQISSKNYLKQIQELKKKIHCNEEKNMDVKSQIQQKNNLILNYQQKIKIMSGQISSLQQNIKAVQKVKLQIKQKQIRYMNEKEELIRINVVKEKQIEQLNCRIDQMNEKNKINEQVFNKKISDLYLSVNAQKEAIMANREIQYQNKLNQLKLNWQQKQKTLKQQQELNIVNLRQEFSVKLQSQICNKNQQKFKINQLNNQYQNLKNQLNQSKIQSDKLYTKNLQLEQELKNQRIYYNKQIQKLYINIRQLNQSIQNYKFQITKLQQQIHKKNDIQELNQQQIHKSKTIIQSKIDQQVKLNQEIKKLKQALKDKGQKAVTQTIYHHTSNVIKASELNNRKVQIIRLKDLKK